MRYAPAEGIKRRVVALVVATALAGLVVLTCGAGPVALIAAGAVFGAVLGYDVVWLRDGAVTIADVGLTYQGPGRLRFWRWEEIEGFAVHPVKRGDMVVVRLRGGRDVKLRSAIDGARMRYPGGETYAILTVLRTAKSKAAANGVAMPYPKPG